MIIYDTWNFTEIGRQHNGKPVMNQKALNSRSKGTASNPKQARVVRGQAYSRLSPQTTISYLHNKYGNQVVRKMHESGILQAKFVGRTLGGIEKGKATRSGIERLKGVNNLETSTNPKPDNERSGQGAIDGEVIAPVRFRSDTVNVQRQAEPAQAGLSPGTNMLGRNHYLLWGFGEREASLAPIHQTALDTIVNAFRILQIGPIPTMIRVDGHSDRSGNTRLDERLSSRRAAAVMGYLYQHRIPPHMVALNFHGSTVPWFPNATRRARSFNRRAEVRIVQVRRPPQQRQRVHGLRINYGRNFRTSEGGVTLNSELFSKVTALSMYLLNRGIARGNIRFSQGVRSRETAHLWSTADAICRARPRRRALMRNLRALPNGRDLGGNLWYRNGWTWNQIVANARPHWPGNTAAEGYPRRDPWRRPNTDHIGESLHIFGRAMDVTIRWRGGAWSARANRIVRQFGLRRPVASEAWHYQLR